MSILREFRDFTIRGNVLDLAVGIVIGAAFSAIVTAVVDNILMPVVGMLTGGINFSGLSINFRSAHLKYGLFIQASITFIIIAAFLFLVVKAANKVKLKTPVIPPISNTEKILISIKEELVAIRKEMNKQ